MSHATLRLFQLLCLTAIGAISALARPAPPPPAPTVWLTVLGEAERADGSWSGVDLLGGADRRVDRFQVTIRPEAAVHVRLEAVTAQGVEPLYPAHPGEAPLAAGRAVALPGPRSFFEIRGEARLRVVVSPADASGAAESALRPSGTSRMVHYPLTDGAAAQAIEQPFVLDAGGPAALELPLHGG